MFYWLWVHSGGGITYHMTHDTTYDKRQKISQAIKNRLVELLQITCAGIMIVLILFGFIVYKMKVG